MGEVAWLQSHRDHVDACEIAPMTGMPEWLDSESLGGTDWESEKINRTTECMGQMMSLWVRFKWQTEIVDKVVVVCCRAPARRSR